MKANAYIKAWLSLLHYNDSRYGRSTLMRIEKAARGAAFPLTSITSLFLHYSIRRIIDSWGFLIIRIDHDWWKNVKWIARAISRGYSFIELVSLPDLWQWRVEKERDRPSEMSMKRTFSFLGTDKSKRNTDDWFTPALRGFPVKTVGTSRGVRQKW